MSQWGVIYDDEGDLHVAPLTPDGRLDLKHSLHEFCPCGPKEEHYKETILYVHQDPEKGGCNS